MDKPNQFPHSSKNAEAIDAMLSRVRNLDKEAKTRLRVMLDEEMDLPYLDVMEREYALAFRRIAPEHANVLRGRFVQALNTQRAYLVGLVRNVLQECEETDLHDPR